MLPLRKLMFIFFRTQSPMLETWIKNKLVKSDLFRNLCFAFRDNINQLTHVKNTLNKELYYIMKNNPINSPNSNNIPQLKRIIQRFMK